MKSAVEAFTLSVPFRMVGRGPWLLDAVHLAEFLDDCRFKVSTLIRMDPRRHSVMQKPMLEKGLGSSVRCLVPGGDGLCELGKHICHHQDVLPSIAGLVHQCIVDGNHFQGTGGLQTLHWHTAVLSGRLGQLAPLAGSNSSFDIRLELGPIRSSSYEFQSSLRSLMSSKIMKILPNTVSKYFWNHKLLQRTFLWICDRPVQNTILHRELLPLFTHNSRFGVQLLPGMGVGALTPIPKVQELLNTGIFSLEFLKFQLGVFRKSLNRSRKGSCLSFCGILLQ